MGTSGMVRFFDRTDAAAPFAAMYVQCDGYVEGLGYQLKAHDFQIINGIQEQHEAGKFANGMGCYAAQVVASLKTEIGTHYLTKPLDPGSCAYTYDLRPSGGPTGSLLCKVWGYDGKRVEYDGPLSGLVPSEDTE